MRWLLGLTMGLLALSATALEVVETPRINGIDPLPLEQRAAEAFANRIEQARARGELGCKRYCAEISSATRRVLEAARAQGEIGQRTAWQIRVVSGDVPEALSMPGGRILLSEGLIAEMSLSEAEIAFVLAHEVAHVLLQHERQTLALAEAMVQPRGLTRSVEDLYFQMGYDLGLLLELEPLLKASEMEADQAALLLGAMAGYRPEHLLGFLRKLAVSERGGDTLIATHPDGPARLAALRAALPLAQGIWRRYGHGHVPTSAPRGTLDHPDGPSTTTICQSCNSAQEE